MLSKGIINSNPIIDGELTCNCSENYKIEAGILKVEKERKK